MFAHLKREDFESGDRVIDRLTRKKGIVTEDTWSVCAPEEVPVIFDGHAGYEGTDAHRLLKIHEN